MDINAYCALAKEPVAGLATRIGLHRGHLHKIASGERGWTSEIALLIEDRTKGAITVADLARVRRRYLRRQRRSKTNGQQRD
jgi:DNA-binding transcriptional regulator YdaS (Cro superfamily)